MGASAMSITILAAVILALIKARRLFSIIAEWLAYLLVVRPLLPRSRDVQGPKCQKTLQVIICGLPRTGTTSMRLAMEILGFPCLHGAHLVKPTTVALFEKAMEHGMAQDWKNFLHGYGAIADWPGACAYKKLLEVYPNAKVILTVRHPNEWYASFSQTILQINQGYRYLVSSFMCPDIRKCARKYFFNEILRGRPNDRESYIEAYNQHIENVKAYVDPNKLLIYEVGKDDGWTSLCKFLNVPHPDVPFPSSNDRKEFLKKLRRRSTIRTIVAISYITLAFLTVGLILIMM